MPDEKTINERLVAFTGKACIGDEFELGDDVCFKVKGGVVMIEERDNQDGTKDKVYKIKLVTAEYFENE